MTLAKTELNQLEAEQTRLRDSLEKVEKSSPLHRRYSDSLLAIENRMLVALDNRDAAQTKWAKQSAAITQFVERL